MKKERELPNQSNGVLCNILVGAEEGRITKNREKQ
jgi:hypothetical protein